MAAVRTENRDAIALLERLGDATRGKLGRELRFDVDTQSEFLLKAVDSAGKSLTKSDDAK